MSGEIISFKRLGLAISAIFVGLMIGNLVMFLSSGMNAGWNTRRAASDGRSISKSVYGDYLEMIANPSLAGESPIPTSAGSNGEKGWPTSSAYFTSLCSNDVLAVDWAFFRAGRVPPQSGRYGDGTHSNALQSVHNAWVVVEDIDPAKTDSLFLYTRNIQGSELESNPRVSLRPDGTVFDREAVVGVTLGGEAIELQRRRQFKWGKLNPTGQTNKALRP